MSQRNLKGNSIIDFPSDYTVIDIETTGLSPLWNEIIELGAIRYRNGSAMEEFQTFVKCSAPLDPFISDLTGITDEMLSNAPDIRNAIREYIDFIGNDIIIGHNIGFDINFIYDACIKYIGRPFSNDYINTVRLANKLLPDLGSKTLSSICCHYGISLNGAHRALHDCVLTNDVYTHMLSDIPDREAFTKLFIRHRVPGHSFRAKDINISVNAEINEDSSIYGRVFCFTGKLDQMTRKEAAQIVVNMGGLLDDSVTKKTNYLVLGSTDYCKTIKNGKTSKQKKAESYISKGFDLQIITEDVFYEMLDE